MSADASAVHAPDLPPFGVGGTAPTPARLGHWAAFYLGMPLLLAIPLGWYGAGLASQASRPVGLLMWSLIVCLSWWCSDLCTRALAFVRVDALPRTALGKVQKHLLPTVS